MESTNKGPDTLAGEHFPPSEKQDGNQSVQLTTQATSPASDRKGGGPRTAQGKRKTSQNASKHKIFSQVLLLNGEPRAEFESLRSGLWNHFEPEGMLEGLLVDKLSAILWRHRRLIIAEGERKGTEILGWGDNITGVLSLELLLRYESNLERAFDRTLIQLERLQRIRNGQPVPPTLDVNVTT